MWATTEDVVAEHRDLKATAVSIDATGRLLVLASRLGISIVDLNTPERVLKHLSRKSKWDIGVVAWNQHGDFRHLIAVGCNQKVDVLHFDHLSQNMSDQGNSIKGHARAVLDLDWSPSEPTLLVSSSVDNYVYIWDSKNLRQPIASLPSLCGASQAKWSKLGRNLLATAHEAEFKIWDFRKTSTPVAYVPAHASKINGIDWSSTQRDQLVTCSQDCTVKVWDTNSLREPRETIVTQSSVWRARFTPFVDSLVTVGTPQVHRADCSLLLWSLHDTSSPVHVFSGHTEGVYDFFWRCNRNKMGIEAYQLVSWSKDHTLRLWKVDHTIRNVCSPTSFAPGFPNFRDASDENLRNISPPITNHLESELKNFEIPNVSLEDVDFVVRKCALIFTSSPISVKLIFSFPIDYPSSAQPIVILSADSSLSQMHARQVSQLVSEAAAKSLQNQSGALHSIAKSVQQFLNGLSADLTPSPRVEGHPAFISPPAINPPSFKSATSAGLSSRYMGPQRVESPLISAATAKLFGSHVSANFPTDQPMPLPRVMGGCFAGEKLIVWSDAWRLGFVAGGKSLIGLGTTVYPSDLQQLQRQTRKQLMKRGRAERPSIAVYNVGSLLPFPPFLAASYRNDSRSPGESLETNAQLSEEIERRDLAGIWRLLKVVVHQSKLAESDIDETPWALHPFGRSLIDKVIDCFRDHNDAAFLATLSCILCESSCSDPQRLRQQQQQQQRPSPSLNRNNKSKSDNGISLSTRHHSLRSDDIFDDPTNGSPTNGSVLRDGKRAATSWMHFPSLQHDSRALAGGRVNGDTKTMILNPERAAELDLFKMEYCDLLYAFRLLNKRVEIMKCLAVGVDGHRGLEYANVCRQCRSEVRGARCFSCMKSAVVCAICHLPVRGLSSFCLGCGHGGHSEHMAYWFSTQVACPTGCGCCCLEAMADRKMTSSYLLAS